jgi:hypothetical protein
MKYNHPYIGRKTLDPAITDKLIGHKTDNGYVFTDPAGVLSDGVPQERLCSCGSGEEREAAYDARGIFLTFACRKCRKEKLSGYRADVLTDANYECDEAIEPEDY